MRSENKSDKAEENREDLGAMISELGILGLCGLVEVAEYNS